MPFKKLSSLIFQDFKFTSRIIPVNQFMGKSSSWWEKQGRKILIDLIPKNLKREYDQNQLLIWYCQGNPNLKLVKFQKSKEEDKYGFNIFMYDYLTIYFLEGNKNPYFNIGNAKNMNFSRASKYMQKILPHPNEKYLPINLLKTRPYNKQDLRIKQDKQKEQKKREELKKYIDKYRQINIKEFQNLLKSHDWTYDYSDDYSWVKSGQKERQEIYKSLRYLNDFTQQGDIAQKLYKKYYKLNFGSEHKGKINY